MPGDLPAMVTAATVNMAATLATIYLKAGAVALFALLNDINFMNQKKILGITSEMARTFAEADPRPYLAGTCSSPAD